MSAACKWLDVAKAVQQIESDYALAKRLGVSRSRLSQYRIGGSISMDDALAVRVAELAQVTPGVVLAELAAEKAKSPEARAVWLSMAKALKQAA